MINVLLVDDHDIFRAGLRRIIADWDDFSVIGEATNGLDAYLLCQQYLPDIVLMDINMPVMGGVEATGKIYREFPSIRVVMLTVSDDKKDLFLALKNGAQGYILKNAPVDVLHSQLKGVMENSPALSGPMAEKILYEFRRLNSDHPALQNQELSPLTEREIDVLKIVSEGLSDAEIASRLSISELTVKKHLHNILQKLQLNNRVQAAVYAVRSGISR